MNKKKNNETVGELISRWQARLEMREKALMTPNGNNLVNPEYNPYAELNRRIGLLHKQMFLPVEVAGQALLDAFAPQTPSSKWQTRTRLLDGSIIIDDTHQQSFD